MQAVVLLLPDNQSGFTRPLGVGSWALPIGNQTCMELMLRWLERCGLAEVLLVTSPGWAAPLGAHLHQAGWQLGGCSRHALAVHVLPAPGCLSEGEALRFVEQKDVVKGDFVLVSGSVISNVDLRPAMQVHAARRGADRQALMTVLLHGRLHAAESPSPDDCMVVVDPRSCQLLKLEHGGRAQHAASLGTNVFGGRNTVAIRSGLRLAHVYICAPDALVLLSDNFDYQTISSDLVPGVLSEQELGSTLHIHELTRGYAERVGSRSEYAVVIEDAVDRWTYPWVPDNTGNQDDACRFNRGRYVDASAAVAPSSRVSKGSLVGRGSIIDAGARLERSIVGSYCQIGTRSFLQGSCVHAHVRVDDNCRLSFALLAQDTIVRSHALVETGALLARQTVIDTAHCVPAGACVSLTQPHVVGHADSDEEADWPGADANDSAAVSAAAAALAAGGIPEVAVPFDEGVVGPFGAGFDWTRDAGAAPFVFTASAPARPSECDSEAGDFTKDAASMEDAGRIEGGRQAAAPDQFKREVAETFLRCISEGISHENAVIELNGLKIAEDRTFADCARYIFTTMLALCLPAGASARPEHHALFPSDHVDLQGKGGRLELLRRLHVQLRAWKDLLRRFLKSNDDQVELLLTFEEFCNEEGDFSAADNGHVFADLFPQVVKLCYDHDLLCEDAILDWASEKDNAAQEDRHFVDLCSDLLAWLADAEEESSGDSE